MYADDLQLYITFKPVSSSFDSATESLKHCIEDISSWMSSNKLKLNENKTEVIILAKKNQPSFSQLSIGNTSVSSSTNVRNLGVSLDKELNMQSQVTSVCKSAYFHLKNIARVRKYLTVAAAESLVHAFITSRIDYCNSLLYEISNLVISKLQQVQNSAGRLILHVKKREHITPTLVKLH